MHRHIWITARPASCALTQMTLRPGFLNWMPVLVAVGIGRLQIGALGRSGQDLLHQMRYLLSG